MGSESEFQIVGAANENDLQPYFFNISDGTVLSGVPYKKIVSFLMVCRVAIFLLYRKVLTHVRL